MNPWIMTAWVAVGTLLVSSMLRETASGRGLAHQADRSRTWFFAATLATVILWPVVMVWLVIQAVAERLRT